MNPALSTIGMRTGCTMRCGGTGVESVTFDAYGGRFFTGSDDSNSPVLMRDVETGEILRRFSGAWRAVDRLALSPDGRFLLGAMQHGQGVIVWEFRTGQVVRGYRDMPGYAIYIAPDSQRVVVGAANQAAYVLDLTSGAEHHRFPGQRFRVQDLAFSPDGAQILTVEQEEGLSLWDTATGQQLRHFVYEGAAINATVFAPDGQTVLPSITIASSSGEMSPLAKC